MFRVTYKDVFEQSWRVLKGNFVLFLPNLFMFLIALILGITYFWISGFYDFFVHTIALPDKAISEQLLLFVVEQWGWLLLLSLVYLVLLFCSDIFFSLTKYGMIKDVIASQKSVLKDGVAFARKHFSSSFMIHLFSVILILLPLFFFGILIAKFFTAITLITLFGVFVFMYKILAIFRLVLPYPVMAFERKGAYKSIRTDLHYLKTQLGHLFISWFIIIGFAFIWMRRIIPIDIGDNAEVILIISIIASLLVFEMVLSTWEQLYVIDAHLSKKRIKKRRK